MWYREHSPLDNSGHGTLIRGGIGNKENIIELLDIISTIDVSIHVMPGIIGMLEPFKT